MTMSIHTSPQKIAVPSVFAGKQWQQVLERDARADGQFFYAVKSTGVYCRPSCPSRRPKRKNVKFFPTPDAARAAGYRACMRCEPDTTTPKSDPQAGAIAAVTDYIDKHQGARMKLDDVAKATGVGKFTILRGFKRVLGVSPGEYGRAQRMTTFKAKLGQPKTSITDAIYDTGFGSSSRLYEDSNTRLGMTPTTLRAGGRGTLIRYAIGASPLGKILVAATALGVCSITFGDDDQTMIDELRGRFPRAELKQMDAELEYAVQAVLEGLDEHAGALQLPMDVRATAFQQRVWRELQAIPRGQTRSYSQVAAAIGMPNGARAVASACAANPVALLVPCHRVLGKNGSLTGYRWGTERKRALLAREGAL